MRSMYVIAAALVLQRSIEDYCVSEDRLVVKTTGLLKYNGTILYGPASPRGCNATMKVQDSLSFVELLHHFVHFLF